MTCLKPAFSGLCRSDRCTSGIKEYSFATSSQFSVLESCTSAVAEALQHMLVKYKYTNIFLREVAGTPDALVVDVNLQLLDHVRQPARHGAQQGVHVGHV